MPAHLDIEPWPYAPADAADESGLVGIGADLEPETIISAYRAGLFPMPINKIGDIGWWSPDPRGILPLDQLIVSRSLRQSMRNYTIRIDTAFDEVIDARGDTPRPGGWISPAIRKAYRRLHQLGWAHSVEAFAHDGSLAGGLYGVSIGGLFAGESMFHRERDASKVALVALVEHLKSAGAELLDIQWTTPHLVSLGAIDLDRDDYLEWLADVVDLKIAPWTQ